MVVNLVVKNIGNQLLEFLAIVIKCVLLCCMELTLFCASLRILRPPPPSRGWGHRT